MKHKVSNSTNQRADLVPQNQERIISKKQKEELIDFLYDHQEEIWDIAVSCATDIEDAVVYLDGISTRQYKLMGGSYTTGTVENPENIQDAIVIYSLPRNWDDAFSDDRLCREWDEEHNCYVRKRGHYKYDEENPENNRMTAKEAWEEVYDVGYENFVLQEFPGLIERLEEMNDDWKWEKEGEQSPS